MTISFQDQPSSCVQGDEVHTSRLNGLQLLITSFLSVPKESQRGKKSITKNSPSLIIATTA
jgi:hypothetical protein